MKKVLVFLLACFASTAMFAQTHWTQVTTGEGVAGTNTSMTGMLYIDHVLYYDGVQTPEFLEIGVFDQDGVCRAAKLPSYRASKDQWVYQLVIKGGEGFSYTFRIWDHETNQELDLEEDFGETITWGSGKKYGSLSNPYEINFHDPNAAPAEPSVIEGGFWNQVSTWEDGIIPENIDVIINGVVTIPANYTAYANNITFNDGGELIIAEGGELYHNGEVAVTLEMTVNGWNPTKEGEAPSGYRLIASPVYTDAENETRPVDGTNLNEGEFDLYKFDQGASDGKEWINFEAAAFDLKLTEGYLYASNATNSNIRFIGITVPTTADKTAQLAYTTGAEFDGWNLLGNPFTCKAYVTDGTEALSYYVLEDDGTAVNPTPVAAGTAINVMKGFFIEAGAAGVCTLTTTNPSGSKGSLNIMVSQGRATLDKAIVNFGEGSNLGKLQFNPNLTKVYMTEDGNDYAVLRGEAQGVMPVSFKAEKNGTYTLSFTNEDVTFGYLHLIDNMTGNDVDLLTNPSYTFDASTTDYASRFTLVYSTGNNGDSDNFAFFSNGSFVISNDGMATLQVIDINGRILSSENINGCASVNVDAAAGVYMLRLVNGENVKVQKVVVR